MHKNFTRREFLKTTGAAVLAVAAAGALSACGGSGSSGYIPNPNPSTARTLGNLTFDYVGEGSGSETFYNSNKSVSYYKEYYAPVFSVTNTLAAGSKNVPLSGVKFTLKLKDGTTLNPTTDTTDDNKCASFVNAQKLSALTLNPGQTETGYIGFARQTTTSEGVFQIIYLTIEYGGKKVTYTLDAGGTTAGEVTNA